MPYVWRQLLHKMGFLSAEQLTGRARTHVLGNCRQPPCTLHPDAAAAFLELRAGGTE